MATYVTAGEVTTLGHEVADYTVELGSSVTVSLLTSAESTEVLSGSRDSLVEEVEVDTTPVLGW